MYDRTIDGEAREFGALGIETGTLMMYDAETKSKWSQILGHAVSGPMSGKKLGKIDATMTTWKKWKALHPDTTAYIKRNVRVTDFSDEHFAGLAGQADFSLENVIARARNWFALVRIGGLLKPTDLVIGVDGDKSSKAYLASYLAKARVVNDVFEGRPTVVAMSDDYVTARVYDRRAGDKLLTFVRSAGEDRLTDVETGSIWNLMTGEAMSGPLEGKRLEPLVSTSALWFAWRKYRPATELVGES